LEIYEKIAFECLRFYKGGWLIDVTNHSSHLPKSQRQLILVTVVDVHFILDQACTSCIFNKLINIDYEFFSPQLHSS
jgi:hypothetical protein